MEVEIKGTGLVTTIDKISAGECFLIPCGHTVYIKTKPDGGFYNERIARVVSMPTGNIYEFPMNKVVIPLKAKLIVERL